MAKCVYAIEGLDRLGKSTLIDGIQQRLGFYQVVHFGKPEVLDIYRDAVPSFQELPHFSNNLPAYSKYVYQRETFINSMVMAQSGARLIFDRWHLGEDVYAPLYRGYTGEYVFALERAAQLHLVGDIRLILLTEDFDRSLHFVSDGNSFDDSKRVKEQELFVQAFQKSIILDKRIICVTGLNGKLRSRDDILDEALE